MRVRIQSLRVQGCWDSAQGNQDSQFGSMGIGLDRVVWCFCLVVGVIGLGWIGLIGPLNPKP